MARAFLENETYSIQTKFGPIDLKPQGNQVYVGRHEAKGEDFKIHRHYLFVRNIPYDLSGHIEWSDEKGWHFAKVYEVWLRRADRIIGDQASTSARDAILAEVTQHVRNWISQNPTAMEKSKNILKNNLLHNLECNLEQAEKEVDSIKARIKEIENE